MKRNKIARILLAAIIIAILVVLFMVDPFLLVLVLGASLGSIVITTLIYWAVEP